MGLLLSCDPLFIIGNFLGAVAAWPRSPQWLRAFADAILSTDRDRPPVLLAFLLLFFVRLSAEALPLGGAYSIGVVRTGPGVLRLDLAKHQILPALALIFGSVAGWVLSMRGMGITSRAKTM